MRRTVTYRLGAASAAVVFAVTSGVTSMEVHQLAAHGTPPLATPTTPPPPVAAGSDGHEGDRRHAGHGHEGHHANAERTSQSHASHQTAHDPAEQDHRAPRSDYAGSDHAGSGHSGHSEHGSTECTCMGPCASGAPPSLGEPTFAEMGLAEPDHVQVVTSPVDPVHQDPRTYLLPFSNAPPVRV
jgi:hypothetical protein